MSAFLNFVKYFLLQNDALHKNSYHVNYVELFWAAFIEFKLVVWK